MEDQGPRPLTFLNTFHKTDSEDPILVIDLRLNVLRVVNHCNQSDSGYYFGVNV